MAGPELIAGRQPIEHLTRPYRRGAWGHILSAPAETGRLKAADTAGMASAFEGERV